MNWVYENWDIVGGLSFFPSDDHVYRLAPYEEISREEYERLEAAFPKDIDYSLLASLENDDNTTGRATSLARAEIVRSHNECNSVTRTKPALCRTPVCEGFRHSASTGRQHVHLRQPGATGLDLSLHGICQLVRSLPAK